MYPSKAAAVPATDLAASMSVDTVIVACSTVSEQATCVHGWQHQCSVWHSFSKGNLLCLVGASLSCSLYSILTGLSSAFAELLTSEQLLHILYQVGIGQLLLGFSPCCPEWDLQGHEVWQNPTLLLLPHTPTLTVALVTLVR